MNMNDLKFNSLRAAMDAGLQNDYTPDGKPIANVDKLLEGAKKIEAYLNEKETRK